MDQENTCLGEKRVIVGKVDDLLMVVSRLADVKDGLDIRIDKPREIR